jgi:hypothetical protein
MSSTYTQDFELNEENIQQKSSPGSLYMISHMIISFFAIYLSWRCNNGFNLMSFLLALICPYLYIIFALATRGGCGIFDANCLVEPIRRLSP